MKQAASIDKKKWDISGKLQGVIVNVTWNPEEGQPLDSTLAALTKRPRIYIKHLLK